MDYLFTLSIAGVGLRMACISYDVGCQWWVNFHRRLPSLPSGLHIPPSFLASMTALVPKFHLQGHDEKCHSPFSFNYFTGGGCTDGEGVEHNWDELNSQGPSTAEMCPRHRWETLDDCCTWVNWRKMMGLGMCLIPLYPSPLTLCIGNLLLCHLLVVIPQARQTHRDFLKFTETLEQEDPDELALMRTELAAWTINKSQPDPYHLPKSSKFTCGLCWVTADTIHRCHT